MTDIRCSACGGLGRYALPTEDEQGLERPCERCNGEGFVEERKRTCPHCGERARLMPPLGYYSEYDCQRCGVFRVSGTLERLIELGSVDLKATEIRVQGGNRCLVEEIASGWKIPRWGRDRVS
jgi:hypothetical protein